MRCRFGEVETTNRVEVLTPRLAGRETVDRFQLLIVCVKHADLDAALTDGLRWLEPDGSVLILVNGIGQRAIVGERWSADRVWCGAVTYGALLVSEGTVRRTGEGVIRMSTLSPSDAADEESGRSFAPLIESGITIELKTDVELMLWEKAIVNCAINPVAALLGATNGELHASPAFTVSRAIARETAEIGRAHLVASQCGEATIGQWDVIAGKCEEMVEAVALTTSTNRCSMLRDLESNKRTEIDALNLAVVRRAEELGRDAPLNRAMAALVQSAECTGS